MSSALLASAPGSPPNDIRDVVRNPKIEVLLERVVGGEAQGEGRECFCHSKQLRGSRREIPKEVIMYPWSAREHLKSAEEKLSLACYFGARE